MRFPTPFDIQSMRLRGFEQSTIGPLEEKCKRAEAVRGMIRLAFSDVTLGNGIGLLQGQALDDYADELAQVEARERDETSDWRKISSNALNYCHSSLSFFDQEGMRFHLPAFMLADLSDEYGYDLSFHLAMSADYDRQFAILNNAQRNAVRAYLLLIRDEPDMGWEREHIDRAVEGYWSSDKPEA